MSNRSWRALRARVFTLLGESCAYCGFKDRRALQLDHINGGGNAMKVSLGIYAAMEDALIHLEKYQILCANCNVIKEYDLRGSSVVLRRHHMKGENK